MKLILKGEKQVRSPAELAVQNADITQDTQQEGQTYLIELQKMRDYCDSDALQT